MLSVERKVDCIKEKTEFNNNINICCEHKIKLHRVYPTAFKIILTLSLYLMYMEKKLYCKNW